MAKRDITGIDLPPDVQALVSSDGPPLSDSRLADLGRHLADKRQEAVDYRKAHGIEQTWALCEDAYNGVDEANRGEYSTGRWIKPTVLNAPITTGGQAKGTEDKRSTAFVRLTSRYVDAAAAKIGEILLPTDDKAFSFEPEPVPELVAGMNDLSQMKHQGVPLTRPLKPDEMLPAVPYGTPYTQPLPAPATAGPPGQPPSAGPPGAPPVQAQVPLTTKDVAEDAMERAKDAAKRAETRIWDWQIDCQHHRETRKVIHDAARIGVGVSKGPCPVNKKSMAVSHVTDPKTGKKKLVLEIKTEIVPADKWVDPWNIFPDPACGENIRNGDYVFEREYFSEKQIRKLEGLPGYIDGQIDKVLKEGPKKAKTETKNPNEAENKHQYEVWYFTGTVDRTEFAAANAKAAEDLDVEQKYVYAIVTIINDTVVRAAINPLDSGELPYHSMPWQRRSGYWAGVGVSEQIYIPQRIVNAATRALLNNAGISGGPQIVLDQGAITPANGDWFIHANKIWYKNTDATTDDVRKAFITFEIPNVGKSLMEVIEYGMKLAEESTSIPLITQGQSGPTTPETLGATQLQNNNANQLLRSIGYNFDDFITEPQIRMYYEYLLLDPKVPDEEKGSFKINAHGSVAMVERSIQDQTIAQMTPLTENPIYGVNPKKWFAMLAKSKHLDPTNFQYSKEEQAKIDATPAPPPPEVMVAQIKAQTAQAQLAADAKRYQDSDALDREIAQLDAQSAQAIEKLKQSTIQLRIKLDTDRDNVYVKTEMERAQAEFTNRTEELRLKKELAMMDYASKHQLSLDQVKAKLADTAMKLRVEKELAAADTALDLHKHTTPSADAMVKAPAQVPGKAPRGKSLAQV